MRVTAHRVEDQFESLTARSPRPSSAASRHDAWDEPAAHKTSIFRGDIPEGRMPGLIPFTTIEYEEPLADKLFDRALLHGWLSCIGVAGLRRKESECDGNQAVCARECVMGGAGGGLVSL